MITDLHTHTWRCGHATGNVADYAEAAVRKGVKVLGTSDHAPVPPSIKLNPDTNMNISLMENYTTAVKEARERVPELIIVHGLECSYFPGSELFYKDEFIDKRSLDYLIGAVHNVRNWWERSWGLAKGGIGGARLLKQYVKHYIMAMESGIFTFMAHPDLFMLSPIEWDRNTISAAEEICSAAADLEVPLEINGALIENCRRMNIKYADDNYPFWRIAGERGVKVVVNSDAHEPENVTAGFETAGIIIDNYSLEVAELSFLNRKR
jgi:histidinol-phosphatase (PHP family)